MLGGKGAVLDMAEEEKSTAIIVAFLVHFVAAVPREEKDERLCLPVFVEKIVGFEVCEHK